MVRNSLRLLAVLSLALICIGIGACSGLTESDKPAATSWWLVPYTGVAQVKAPDSVLPVIVSISVVPGLDTDRILALTVDSELKPFSGARWVDSLPELTESLVSRTLGASARFEPVSMRAGGTTRPCELQLELREFYATLNASGEARDVRVSFGGRYQCESAEPLPIQFKTSILVQDNRMRAIVAAFQEALDKAMRELLLDLSGG